MPKITIRSQPFRWRAWSRASPRKACWRPCRPEGHITLSVAVEDERDPLEPPQKATSFQAAFESTRRSTTLRLKGAGKTAEGRPSAQSSSADDDQPTQAPEIGRSLSANIRDKFPASDRRLIDPKGSKLTLSIFVEAGAAEASRRQIRIFDPLQRYERCRVRSLSSAPNSRS